MRVEFTQDGKARRFVSELDPRDRARVAVLFTLLEARGRIDNVTKFKRLRTGLWEMKADRVRLLGDFRPGGRFVVAHGIIKKATVLDQAEVRHAERMLTDEDRRAA